MDTDELQSLLRDHPLLFVLIPLVFLLLLWMMIEAVGKILRDEWIDSERERLKRAPNCPADQPWRAMTDVRFIEALKKGIDQQETAILTAFIYDRFLSVKLDALRAETGLFVLLTRMAWNVSLSGKDPGQLRVGQYEAYLESCAQLDRIWAGNARLEIGNLQVEIQKQKRQRQDCTSEEKSKLRDIDERIIDLERDLRDLQEWVAKPRTTPHAAQFEEKKTRRRFDVQDEVFEAFERPFEKEIELRVKYNELVEKIRRHPQMSKEEKDSLLKELDRRFQEHVSKDKRKHGFNIYEKEA